MKLIFLSKRHPMDRDLISRPYGRFYHLPHLLAEKGHTVTAVLLSYKKDGMYKKSSGNETWISISAWPTGPFDYIRMLTRIVKETRPDWIVGFSDTYYGILAAFLGEKFGIKSCIDVYDNYESYIPWLKPLHLYWRKAVSKATVVTAAGPQLARHLNTFRPGKKVHVVPMAADPSGFKPLDKVFCRRKLHLPLDKKIVGYCGSIYRNRGVEIMFRAFEQLHNDDPEIEMVLTGRKQKGVHIPAQVQWLGYLPDDQIPIFLNSVDVLLVVNRLSDFGKFSYPVKLYETMKCHIPVVATETEATNWILNNNRDFLSTPEDPTDLAQKIKRLLNLGRFDYGMQNSWVSSCRIFEQALFACSSF